jgi:hypothetical protein
MSTTGRAIRARPVSWMQTGRVPHRQPIKRRRPRPYPGEDGMVPRGQHAAGPLRSWHRSWRWNSSWRGSMPSLQRPARAHRPWWGCSVASKAPLTTRSSGSTMRGTPRMPRCPTSRTSPSGACGASCSGGCSCAREAELRCGRTGQGHATPRHSPRRGPRMPCRAW